METDLFAAPLRRPLAWGGTVLGALLVLWLGLRTPIRRTELLALPCASFTDADKGGGSVATQSKARGELEISWELRPGTPYPYCGVVWKMRPDEKPLDVSDLEGLEVLWRSSRSQPVRWTFETDDPEAPLGQRLRFVQYEIRPPTGWTRAFLPAKDFQVPLWWFQSHRRMVDTLRHLERTVHVTFSSGESALHGVPDTVRVRSLLLLRKGKRQTAFLLLLIPFALLLVLLRRRNALEPKLPLPPLPLELPPTPAQKVVVFLAANYARPELDLALTARETGLPEAAVSAGVKEATGEGFRQHLGRLRLTEAARLVRETRLQMTEIAFRVGYGNVSHFNRQFRELWGSSPSEMRQGSGIPG
jgi:AraC-like DNA-binding protein